MSDVTDSDALRREYEQLLEFMYVVPVGLADIDIHGNVALMNSACARYLMPLAASPTLANLFDVLDRYAPELRSLTRRHPDMRGTICEARRIDLRALGKPLSVAHLSVSLVKLDSARVMAVIQDISRAVEQERALFADDQRFRAIFESVREAMICTLDAGQHIDSWNASGERLFGFALQEVAGRALAALVARDDSDTKGQSPSQVPPESGWSELEGWSVRKDGTRFWGEGILSVLYDQPGVATGFSLVLRDQTERKLAADKLRELARTDALTTLANRHTFYEHAEREVARRARYKSPVSVLMLDADHFKLVNDTHGHAAGDAVLRDLAAILKANVRATDLAARYGGEEFAVLLAETAASGALVLAERIRTSIEASRVEVDGKVLRYTVSIGVAESAAPTVSLKELLAEADRALYRAKAEGRNRAVLAGTVSMPAVSAPAAIG